MSFSSEEPCGPLAKGFTRHQLVEGHPLVPGDDVVDLPGLDLQLGPGGEGGGGAGLGGVRPLLPQGQPPPALHSPLSDSGGEIQADLRDVEQLVHVVLVLLVDVTRTKGNYPVQTFNNTLKHGS